MSQVSSVSAQASVPVSVPSKALPKKERSKKVSTKVAEVAVEAPVVVKQEVVEAPAEVSETPVEVESMVVKVKDILSAISILQKELKNIENDLKNVRTLYQKETRENNKRNKRKNKRSSANSEPHGFVKEVGISDDLAEFLGVPVGSKIARPQVTRAISKYINANGLALESNRSIFKTDDKLFKLLGKPTMLAIKKKPDMGYAFSYFNLQSVLKDKEHFIKEEKPVVASA